MKTIIWDWNGTLLDDMHICIQSINELLSVRKLPLMDADRYRQIFTFPIIDYYRAAGFDFEKEPFEVPAEEFIVGYKRLLSKAQLFDDAVSTLNMFRMRGVRQFILSAMEQDALQRSLADNGIEDYFDGIYGISDNFAVSKVSRGVELISTHQLNRKETIMIGDTLHDIEVAEKLGIPVLISGRGHQHPDRISHRAVVLNSLHEVYASIFG